MTSFTGMFSNSALAQDADASLRQLTYESFSAQNERFATEYPSWAPQGSVSQSVSSSGPKFVYYGERATWAGARAACRAQGGDLASIHSEAENAEAYALTGGESTWLGLSDAEDEGHWTWSDGSPVDYTPSAGEGFWTDSYDGDEDCAGFWYGHWQSDAGGMWDDLGGRVSCGKSLPYICLVHVPSPPPARALQVRRRRRAPHRAAPQALLDHGGRGRALCGQLPTD